VTLASSLGGEGGAASPGRTRRDARQHVAIKRRQGRRNGEAVLECVTHAGRCLSAVAEHPPTPVRPRPRSAAYTMRCSPPSGVTPATERWKSGLPATTAAGRAPSRTSLAGVEIRQHGLQQLRPLGDAGLDGAIRRPGSPAAHATTARADRGHWACRKLGNRPRNS